MLATKAALASGGDHPLLLAMRFENVFFSVRPIVLSREELDSLRD
jgi:hypothetical protein